LVIHLEILSSHILRWLGSPHFVDLLALILLDRPRIVLYRLHLLHRSHLDGDRGHLDWLRWDREENRLLYHIGLRAVERLKITIRAVEFLLLSYILLLALVINDILWFMRRSCRIHMRSHHHLRISILRCDIWPHHSVPFMLSLEVS